MRIYGEFCWEWCVDWGDAEADFVAFCDSFCGWLMVVLAHRMWKLIWVCVPLILFTLIQNKDLRYFVPYLTALAIVSCLSADLIVNNKGQLAWWGGW